jgi:hypothetical protein
MTGRTLVLPGLFARHLFRWVSGPAKRRYFENLIVKVEVGQPEAPAHEAAVPEEPFYLARRGVCGDVEVLWHPPEKKVANASPDKMGNEPSGAKSVEGAEGILAYIFS